MLSGCLSLVYTGGTSHSLPTAQDTPGLLGPVPDMPFWRATMAHSLGFPVDSGFREVCGCFSEDC